MRKPSRSLPAWDGVEQIFVRLVAGGTPLQITRDSADHALPRWSPDSSAVIYFSPAVPRRPAGHRSGRSRRSAARLAGSSTASEVEMSVPTAGSPCSGWRENRSSWSPPQPTGPMSRVIARFTEAFYFKYPRWSPDGKWIAYQRGDGVRWDLFAVDVERGTPRQLTHDNAQIHGLTWLPDSSGVVYSSSRATTMSYLPTLGLWEQSLAGGEPRRLAVADVSYLQPDMHRRRHDRREPHADAVRSLAIPDARDRGRKRPARRPHHAPDGAGADADDRSRRSRDRVPVGQWRPCQPLDHHAGERRVASDHLRARAGRCDGGADLVARRQSRSPSSRPAAIPGWASACGS